MTASHGWYPLLLVTIAWCTWTAGASAQSALQQTPALSPWALARARVPLGAVVHVTDATGCTVKGKLTALTDEAVRVAVTGGLRIVPAAEVRRIQWQQPDSPLTGVLIGAGVGAMPGLYWLAADPNECAGICPEEYALIAIGALVGGLIDRAITKRVTVFAAGISSPRDGRVSVRPLVQRARKGLLVAVPLRPR